MKRILYFLAGLILIISFNAEAQLSSNPRRAVVLETYHALSYTGVSPCKNISGDCVGDWNYLNDDYWAYDQLKKWYTCSDASIWKKTGDGCSTNSNKPYSYFNNAYAYGLNNYNSPTGSIGHGGQCKHFANLITYRSGMHTSRFPDYASMANNSFLINSQTNLQKVKEGDIIFIPSGAVHTAIVTSIIKKGSTITGVVVVDSNYVGGADNEIIGKHALGAAILNNYRVWKGVAYYNTNYDPNA
jgi:hypothetical protein